MKKSGTHAVPLSFGSFCSFLQAGAESGNAADVVRRCAAAAANEARARFVPLAHEVVIRCRAAVPCLRHGIVRLACIRVDDDGLRGVRADIADEVGHVLRCRAVDADGCDLALLVEQPRAVCDGIATAGVRLILARERDPGPMSG